MNDAVGHSTPEQLLEEALAAHRGGSIGDAKRLYASVLSMDPTNAAAYGNLAIIAAQQGDLAGAERLFRQQIKLRPDDPAGYNNVGSVLQQQARLADAIVAHRQAIKLKPNYAEAFLALGNALRQQGNLEEAMGAYRSAIAVKRDYAEAHNNIGVLLQIQGRLDQAAAAYGEAVALRPAYAEAQFNLGNVLHQKHDLYRRLLDRTPVHADACNNMGTALLAEGRADEALTAFEQALTHRPDFPEAFYNLGNAWRELGDLAAAIAAYRNALHLRPDYADAFCQLVYHRAQACEWGDTEADQEKLVDMVRQGVRVPPFYLLSTPASASDQLLCAQQWIRPIRPPREAIFEYKPLVEKARIRLGYLSGDFHQHATAQLMAELFERHDRDRFEVLAYSYGPDDNSPMRARLSSAFDRFIDIRALSHREAAGQIHADNVDILIDLKGYTHHARPAISAYRPAPVQVNYLGYPATMGADFIDYIIVDRFVVPAGQQPFFAERLVQLPGSYQVNDTRREVAVAGTSRQDHGLPAEGLVFCSFNNSYKISPVSFDIWMRLLRSIPDSVLWLLEANQSVRGNLRSEAEKRGVDPGRLIFAPRVPPADHLERHRHADLFLDTLPCNAHTTASDALWAGLPVLTCSGNTFAGRVAGSLLTAVGMPEMATGSLEEYEQMALALARAPERLTALRQKLEQDRDASALFDLAKLTGNIEAAYARMWQTWLSGQKPAAFSIENA